MQSFPDVRNSGLSKIGRSPISTYASTDLSFLFSDPFRSFLWTLLDVTAPTDIVNGKFKSKDLWPLVKHDSSH